MKAQRILCPIDLSENSLAAVEVATSLAKANNGKLVFLFVSPHWLPGESMIGSDYVESIIAERKQQLAGVKPTEKCVASETLFLQGNPGPEIVRAAKSCDMIVMSTHGYSGVMRLVMGSVSQYTLRNANCPVVLVKCQSIKKKGHDEIPQQERPVTEAMRQIGAIRADDPVCDVIRMLDDARETAAPVVDSRNRCSGILTSTDIENYRQVEKRFAAGDESVVGQVFESNAYGQRRADVDDFHHVRKHMTAAVVTISNEESCRRARELFEVHADINHLVVVDELNHPVGILQKRDVAETGKETSEA